GGDEELHLGVVEEWIPGAEEGPRCAAERRDPEGVSTIDPVRNTKEPPDPPRVARQRLDGHVRSGPVGLLLRARRNRPDTRAIRSERALRALARSPPTPWPPRAAGRRGRRCRATSTAATAAP